MWKTRPSGVVCFCRLVAPRQKARAEDTPLSKIMTCVGKWSYRVACARVAVLGIHIWAVSRGHVLTYAEVTAHVYRRSSRVERRSYDTPPPLVDPPHDPHGPQGEERAHAAPPSTHTSTSAEDSWRRRRPPKVSPRSSLSSGHHAPHQRRGRSALNGLPPTTLLPPMARNLPRNRDGSASEA
jgi:hypothetical protein